MDTKFSLPFLLCRGIFRGIALHVNSVGERKIQQGIYNFKDIAYVLTIRLGQSPESLHFHYLGPVTDNITFVLPE